MEEQRQLIKQLRTCEHCKSTLTYLRNNKLHKKRKERVCRACGHTKLLEEK